MDLPMFEVEFDKKGRIFDPAQVDAAVAGLRGGGFSDLFVISHGWNNDMADARDLYKRFFAAVESVRAGGVPNLGSRKLAILAIFWPSKKFTDEELIPGGGAVGAASGELDEAVLIQQLEDLKTDPERLGELSVDPIRAAILDQAQRLVPALEDDAAAQREFVLLIRSMLSPGEAHPEDGSDSFFTRDPNELLAELAEPVPPPPTGGGGGAASVGGAVGVGDFFSGIKSGARQLLNFTTYYQMKERAGLVGRTGAAQVLQRIRQEFPGLKLHLIGHSFGGRLVTAAADAVDAQVKPATMTLLQAAYSHNGLAKSFDGTHDGFFRKVIGRVTGPILITHTKNDVAVGIAYPLASRIAGQNAASAAGLGDANDPYGGMGRNGAQSTPERVIGELQRVGKPYQLAAAKVYNLLSDDFIEGHSDICKKEVAYALLSAVAVT
jgi:hypothetical protein